MSVSSVSPGRGSSPGFCHIRRQGNRSAQKQIICPIYRGRAAGRPYRMGSFSKFLTRPDRFRGPERLKGYSFLQRSRNRSFPEAKPEVRGSRFVAGAGRGTAIHRENTNAARYSAAIAIERFGFAVDNMKSLMRGTISDLKREPLNTP